MKKFAMVFPGQGSQSIGMLAELGEAYPSVKHTFQQASDVLGYDLWQLVQTGEADELNQTWRTQPALLTASVAIFHVWQEQYPSYQPAVVAGHSLGEFSALVCAGVIDFQDAVKLVELRGRLMQKAVAQGSGAMYAIIGLDDQQIIDLCAQAEEGEVVSAVNFNSPGQVVIAGQKSAVERAAALCKEAGAKRALPLAVSVPSHCLLMKPAADQLAVTLESITFKQPLVPVINNVDVKQEQDAEKIRSALVRQLYSPVRWSETIEKIASQGIDILIEIGPNKVLTGLTKRIDKSLSAVAVNDVNSLENISVLFNE